MTDPIAPEPTPAAPAYAPVPAGPKKALSLTSFILGIAATALFITTWFAILLGVVAVILGFIGRSKEPGAPRWMALIGIIGGFVGIVIGAIILILAIVALATLGNPANYGVN